MLNLITATTCKKHGQKEFPFLSKYPDLAIASCDETFQDVVGCKEITFEKKPIAVYCWLRESGHYSIPHIFIEGKNGNDLTKCGLSYPSDSIKREWLDADSVCVHCVAGQPPIKPKFTAIHSQPNQ